MTPKDNNTPHEIEPQPSTRVRTAECLRYEEECSRRLEKVEGGLKTQEEAMVEHRLRLENGSRVFTDLKTEIAGLRDEIKELTKKTTPKPVDWWKILIPTIGLLVTLLGAWWALSSQLGDRPTNNVVDKLMHEHADSIGHPAMAAEVRLVRDEQIKQGETLMGLKDKVDLTRVDVQDIKVDIRAIRSSRPGVVPQQP